LNKNINEKGLLILILILLIIQIYYFFFFFFSSGIYYQYGYSLTDLTIGLILFSVLMLHGLILISLILIFFGYKNKSSWMRKFTMLYLVWGVLWGFWGILIGNNIIVHTLIISFYLIGFYYLTTEPVKKYFYKIYQYGKYILYTRYVKLKSGKELPIFFFSSHTPKSGSQTQLPEGYTVKENPKSHMPYLKKIEPTKKLIKKSPPLKINSKKTDVIYVVNRLQPGKNRGNWAVRYEKKIYSSHRTKKAAIKNAREIAKKSECRVLVQNTNGRFSYGFNAKKE